MKFSRQLFLIFCTSLVFVATSCTREEETSSIYIQLPEAGPLSHSLNVAQSVGVQTAVNTPWSGTINSRNEINCYLIAVGGPEPDQNKNRCTTLTNGTQGSVYFGNYLGGVPAGSEIKLELKSGPGRVIHLIGMKAEAGSCKDFKNNGPDQGKISYPRVLGSQTINLKSGENNVSFSVPSDLTNLAQIGDCDVSDGPFDGPTGGGVHLFGDQRDGDLILGTSSYTTGTAGFTYQSPNIHSNASPDVPSTKVFSANFRVTNIDTTTATNLTIPGLSSTNEFDVGDEVLWHVSQGAHATLSPDDNACGAGSGLWIGRLDFARVTAVDLISDVITLDKPVTNSPTSIDNVSISSGSYASGTTFCKIQVLRVPSFGTLTVSSAATLSPPTYNNSTGTGGILAFRARILQQNASLTISALGKGFQGVASLSGTGIHGTTNITNGLSTGSSAGSFLSATGGGGGQGGAGGDAVSGALGGSAVSYCQGFACRPISDQKAFLGGSGGAGSGAGGAGGGLIIVKIESLLGASSLQIDVSGGAGGGSAGGGAAGAIHFTNAKRPQSSTVTLNASGGGSSTGGGGGGGVIEHFYCNGTLGSNSYNQNGGQRTTGSIFAGSGYQYLDNQSIPPEMCLP